MQKPYKTIGIGGTFDHFHLGHQKFITFAADYADTVLIGVLNQQLAGTKAYPISLEPFEQRAESVRQFCQLHHIPHQIIELNDVFGPTLENSLVQALAVTSETLKGATQINQRRQKLKLPPLPVQVCELVKDQVGQDIHSERIRAGLVSRTGTVYSQLFTQPLTLTPAQRGFFAQPQGQLLDLTKTPTASTWSAVVGDSSLEWFISHQWPYSLGVFDQKRQRQTVASTLIDNLPLHQTVVNQAGQITPELVSALQHILQISFHSFGENDTTKPYHLKVVGEEDLATVALVLLAPLGSQLYYGQPNQGIQQIVVSEELKDLIYRHLAN